MLFGEEQIMQLLIVKFLPITLGLLVCLGGTVVSVLAIGHKVRGLKSDRGRWICIKSP
jgi:hypothetical protein